MPKEKPKSPRRKTRTEQNPAPAPLDAASPAGRWTQLSTVDYGVSTGWREPDLWPPPPIREEVEPGVWKITNWVYDPQGLEGPGFGSAWRAVTHTEISFDQGAPRA